MTIRELKKLIDRLPDELLDVRVVKTTDCCGNMQVEGAHVNIDYFLDSKGNPCRTAEFIID